ncbi:MAG: hypothetical protein A3F83_07485 [Candidatus Glassbacteria bacterium RIFCSPLOWO2_12_FULL_58_11]|uniref:Uncharacterized protein n=1 Tax=Candidatus Glassbacteria bacterium RIFCSPLOWO2_12_FULL_58_11 TaxID=1817867 RepID=A0A1F5YM72_9BACT|nr:MAG: hypothetical protein A3F83_07485 [Candidatus Glassbacteria bacterium RIFCSPLOWO2_12_FULL_58_11]
MSFFLPELSVDPETQENGRRAAKLKLFSIDTGLFVQKYFTLARLFGKGEMQHPCHPVEIVLSLRPGTAALGSRKIFSLQSSPSYYVQASYDRVIAKSIFLFEQSFEFYEASISQRILAITLIQNYLDGWPLSLITAFSEADYAREVFIELWLLKAAGMRLQANRPFQIGANVQGFLAIALSLCITLRTGCESLCYIVILM